MNGQFPEVANMVRIERQTRLDQLPVERGLAPSPAQALILARRVFGGERQLDKAGPTTIASARRFPRS